MKSIVLTAALLLLASPLVAQEQAKTTPAAASAKALVVSGKVSDDGKTLLTDIDSEWGVSNSEMLKGLEGRLVRVKCYVDSAANKIRVLSVKKEDGGSKYAAARQADSAFRR
jgi:hypothetical protein